ncbi:MAG: hypothetical protein O9292_09670 [Rhodobacteraceae bacterium]|nr:hypothetical protein [Paracoccaceae bacterium]
MKRLLLLSAFACLATPALSQSILLEECRSDLYCPVIGDRTGEVLYLTRPVGLMVTKDGIRHTDGRALAPMVTGALPVTDVDEDDGGKDHAGGHGCGGGKGKGKGGGKGGSGHTSGTETGHETEEGAGGKAGQSCGPKDKEAEAPALEAPALGG